MLHKYKDLQIFDQRRSLTLNYVVMMQKQRKKRMMEEDEVRSFPLILDWHDFYEPNGNDDVLVPRQMESGYMEKITLIAFPLAYSI